MITSERLRKLLSYAPETGVFRWLLPQSNRAKAGLVAGCISKASGYRLIRVDGRLYRAHRLAWLYMYGHEPSDQIDHINCDRSDNRISNLRDVSRDLNAQNRRVARKDSGTGLMGVMRNGDRWAAQIRVNGQRLCLGTFDTPEQAHQRYVEAKRGIHSGCTI